MVRSGRVGAPLGADKRYPGLAGRTDGTTSGPPRESCAACAKVVQTAVWPLLAATEWTDRRCDSKRRAKAAPDARGPGERTAAVLGGCGRRRRRRSRIEWRNKRYSNNSDANCSRRCNQSVPHRYHHRAIWVASLREPYRRLSPGRARHGKLKPEPDECHRSAGSPTEQQHKYSDNDSQS